MDGLEDIPQLIAVPPITFPIPLSEVGRALPDRRVSQETIQDAYVAFILFCNPIYSQDADVTSLKELFSNPPKSNKKAFETFDIFTHVKKLYDHEIKTWQQFAVILGVEPAQADEAASNQRVQQWLVRLKKWMKLTHIDAFFQYLFGKPHDYYLEVPSLHDPQSADGRDGVPAGEDLALRALDPRLRPKRGRKRHEASMQELPPAQRHTFNGATIEDRKTVLGNPPSALPRSGYPDSAVTDRLGQDPWSAISPWPSHMSMSASTEQHSAFSAFPADPRVDTIRTPVMANRLNRWAQNTSPSHGAGQQPNAISPSQTHRPTPPTRTPSNLASGQVLSAIDTAVPPQKNAPEAPMSAVSTASTASKRERQRLQLQVPKHAGGPVQLMTPPVPAPGMGQATPGSEQATILGGDVATQIIKDRSSASAATVLEALRRNLAADLLRADLVGRDSRLSGAEAKALAVAILGKIGLGTDHDGGVESIMVAAVHLGLAHALALPGMAFPLNAASKTLHVTRYVVDSEGYELSVEEARLSGQTGVCKDVFDLEWSTGSGALIGQFKIRGVDLVSSSKSSAGERSKEASRV